MRLRTQPPNSLFIKGARILDFDKIREVCGDYQQLSYAKGSTITPQLARHLLKLRYFQVQSNCH